MAAAAALALPSLAVPSGPVAADEGVFVGLDEIATPAGPGAREPDLFALPDGRVALLWTEPSSDGFAVKLAIRDETGWGAGRTLVESGDLFVNWADFPSIAILGDGTVAAHWLGMSGASSYAYDVNLVLSRDGGATWSAPVKPHRDAAMGQHGFVTLLPVSDRELAVIWLDGRAYDSASKAADASNAMQLRTAFVGSDGSMSAETILDLRTCSCCQTSAAVAEDGTLMVAYRDRSVGEIRDISVVRRVGGRWSEPRTVHADGWEISGCPVNGPAIGANGRAAVVAWFTAARDVPAVKIAFSEDAGATFDPPFRVDDGRAAGRVGAVMLGDGSALVSWVEWAEEGERLRVCRATPADGCRRNETVTLNTAPGSVNFPQMVSTGSGVFLAWSQPGSGGAPDGIRLVKARLRELEIR